MERLRQLFIGLLKNTQWILFGLGCFVFFVFIKFPIDDLRPMLEQQIKNMLRQSSNVQYTALESQMSIIPFYYRLKGVTVFMPGNGGQIQLDELTISPQISQLMQMKPSAHLQIKHAGGSIESDLSMTNNTELEVGFEAEGIQLARLGLADVVSVSGGPAAPGSVAIGPIIGQLQGSGELKGTGKITLDTRAPEKMDADIDLEVSKVRLDEQSLMGWNLPLVRISKGTAQVRSRGGKLKIKKFEIGGSPQDDLRVIANGDVELERFTQNSKINMSLQFGLSPALGQKLPLDMLFKSAKRPDGLYSFNLRGTLGQITPTPGG